MNAKPPRPGAHRRPGAATTQPPKEGMMNDSTRVMRRPGDPRPAGVMGGYCFGSGSLTAGGTGTGLSLTSCCAVSRAASAAASRSLVLPAG
jgi:hypothetical protein